MRIEIAEMLVTNSDGRLTLQAQYSGRYMFGATTAAVVGDAPALLAAVVLATAQTYSDPSPSVVIDPDDLAAELGDLSSDDLGLSTIWY
jgi:hypothetical protein